MIVILKDGFFRLRARVGHFDVQFPSDHHAVDGNGQRKSETKGQRRRPHHQSKD